MGGYRFQAATNSKIVRNSPILELLFRGSRKRGGACLQDGVLTRMRKGQI